MGVEARRAGYLGLRSLSVGLLGMAMAFLSRSSLAAEATLIGDINAAGIESVGFATLGSSATVIADRYYVFVADDGITGLELWVIDLTNGLMKRLADIYPGYTSSNPRNLVLSGSKVYFAATDPVHGEELWVTDGSPGGTVLVQDIYPGTQGSALGDLYPVPAGRIAFRADDGVSGAELWVSDGTDAGTFMVADIRTGAASSSPGSFAYAGGELLFRADDGVHGAELWKSLGASASLVLDIEPGSTGSAPFELFAVGALIVFRACRAPEGCELWGSNGTAVGTILLEDLNPTGDSYPRKFFWHPGFGRYFFVADDGVHGDELWQRTGGVATRLTDLNSGLGDSSPTTFGALGAALTFVATDGTAGSRLYSYDGTTVTLVKVLSTAGVSANAQEAVPLGSRIYLRESSSYCWYTDGTALGTVRWSTQCGPIPLVTGGARVVHGEYVSGEREIWSIDAGLVESAESAFASYSSNPSYMTWLGERLFFAADDGVEGRELWVYDSVAHGLSQVDIQAGPESSTPNGLVVFDGEVWMSAETLATSYELWHSDGTPVGTEIFEIRPGTSGAYPNELTVVGNHLFFSAYDENLGNQLFRVTNASLPADLLDYQAQASLYPRELTPFGTKLLFFAESASTGAELFVIDELGSEPTPLEIVPGPNAPDSLNELVVANGWAYFVADNGVSGNQIWRSNGASVAQVTNFTTVGYPASLTAGPGGLYFAFDDPAFGYELWRTDGTTTARISDIAPGTASASPSQMTWVGNKLFFAANDGSTGQELWWTDGSTVARVADLRPGAFSSQPLELEVAGSRLVFAANAGDGSELWITDGVTLVRLPETWPGEGGSLPESVTVQPGAAKIAFSGLNLETWREPYLVDLLLFADGFETGNSARWSASLP